MDESPETQFTNVAEIYDDLMSVVPYRWWVEYVRKLWHEFGFQPHRVLDLACGTGNVLHELRKRGLQVEGADASEAMLRIARRKFGDEVPLWHQDARCLRLPSPPFDACVCLFDSLNYILELSELEQAFRAIHRILKTGGSLVFDMNAIRALETGMFDQTGSGRDPRLQYEWHSAWDPIGRLCTIHMEFRHETERGIQVFHETHVQRGYRVEEISAALRRAGFDVLAVYDAFSTNPPHARSDRLYYVAQAAPLPG